MNLRSALLLSAPLFSAIALLAACSGADKAAKNEAQSVVATSTIPVVVRSAKGTHRFDVEVARTEAEQEKGLMFRKELGDDAGMLFPM